MVSSSARTGRGPVSAHCDVAVIGASPYGLSAGAHLKAKGIAACVFDEFRAFERFVRSFRIRYEVVAAVYGYTRVCIKVL
jgi:thioredoxin reductase